MAPSLEIITDSPMRSLWEKACDRLGWSPAFPTKRTGTADLCIAEQPLSLKGPTVLVLRLGMTKDPWNAHHQRVKAETLGCRVIQHRHMVTNLGSTPLPFVNPARALMKGEPLKAVEVVDHVETALKGQTPLWAEDHAPFMVPSVPTRVERHPRALEGVLRRDGPEWSMLQKTDLLNLLGHESSKLEWSQISGLVGVEALTSILTWIQYMISPSPSETLGSR